MRRSSLALIATLAFNYFVCHEAQAQQSPQPWREPQDTIEAIFSPDQYAWRLFIALNWPANPATREADSNKALGSSGQAVWESWRNVRSGAPDTVFPSNGADPGDWLGTPGPVAVRQEQEFDQVPIKQQVFLAMRQVRRQSGPVVVHDPAVGTGNEVRLNKAAYDFIRQNQLYKLEGQLAQVNAGALNLNFPAAAKSVKAQWRRINEAQKPRYHWAEVRLVDGSTEVWGMTALHITTKDLPNWFWATFEHIDNKQAGWLTQSRDRHACPTAPHDCETAPTGMGLQGTKWENYRLRGAQVDFTDSIGAPTILANSQIEAPFQRTSSCITCHSLATLNKDGQDAGFAPVVGSPRVEWFQDPQTRMQVFMQLDFLWSLRRASSANPQ